MDVLIVDSDTDRAELWAHALMQEGYNVHIAHGQKQAVSHISESHVDMIVLNLRLTQGSPIAVADYASYRQPNARVIAVSSDKAFSDGSLFAHMGNLRTLLPATTPPSDLGAMVEHYAA